MAIAPVSVQELLESGVHFGHRVSRWNPKMEQYIFGKRNLIHIIDLRQTLKGLIRAQNFLLRLAGDGREVLFVGTKRQAKAVVEAEARRSGMPYVTERWLGGTLTNFETITRRLERLEELEKMEDEASTVLFTKKELARFNREKRKLLRNLEGIRHMKRLPGVVLIVDPRREHIAVLEAYKLGIPTICLIDTDSDPELIDIPIPGNDDAMRSIQVILHKLTESIMAGVKVARTAQGIDIKKRQDDMAEAGMQEKPKTFVVRRKTAEAPAAEAGTGAPEAAAAEAEKPAAPQAEAEKPAAPQAEGEKPSAPKAEGEKPAAPKAEGEKPAAPKAEGE